VIDVTLIEIRPGKDSTRIGVQADRDIAVDRMEVIEVQQ
jgi:sRNA-binding carbon storage regulator CsrA